MVIGILKVTVHLHGVFSLKEKRSIIKSLIGRLKSRFNVSLSEIAAHDNKQAAVIGIAVITAEGSFLDSQLDNIISFIHNDLRIVVARIEREVFFSDI